VLRFASGVSNRRTSEHHQRLPGLVSKGVQMTDKVLGTGESGQVYEVRIPGSILHCCEHRRRTNNLSRCLTYCCHQGIMVKTGMKVAIKTEPVNAVRQKLQHEKEILSQLRGTPGIPQVQYSPRCRARD
jgi:predicted Ser/Thr protein kinase